MTLETNNFFDINKLPQEEGLLLWGISMNRIGNSQSGEKVFNYFGDLYDKVNQTDGIGNVVLYADYLYFNSKRESSISKNRYIDLMIAHKNNLLNTLSQNPNWVKKAFSFYTFGQMIVDNSSLYIKTLQLLTNMYNTDPKFREAVIFDVKLNKKAEQEEEEELAVKFILEEITIFYLFAKGCIKTNNEFVRNPVWTLQCYPGKPLKSEVYLFQQNPMKLENPKNKFEYCYYDLDAKILYDYKMLDIDTFDFNE